MALNIGNANAALLSATRAFDAERQLYAAAVMSGCPVQRRLAGRDYDRALGLLTLAALGIDLALLLANAKDRIDGAFEAKGFNHG